jgi:hypothetical protein
MSGKSLAITIIIALVVGVGGFYGGTIYEKGSLSKQGLLRSSASGQGGNEGQRGPGGQGGGRFGQGPGGANGNFVAGQITAKSDNSITVQGRDGSSKIVFFSGSTSIGKAVQGATSDLASGQQVVVSGTNNSDGTVTAQNIQIRPADQQPLQPQQ